MPPCTFAKSEPMISDVGGDFIVKSIFKAIVLKVKKNLTTLQIEEKRLVSNTVYKAPINIMVDYTPLRRHPRVNKDERSTTCIYTHILPTSSFYDSSNTDAN